MKKPWYIILIKISGWSKVVTILNFIIGNSNAISRPEVLVHELVHVKRQFMFLGLFWFLLYKLLL